MSKIGEYFGSAKGREKIQMGSLALLVFLLVVINFMTFFMSFEVRKEGRPNAAGQEQSID